MNPTFVWIVFGLVYLGMLLGRLPGLALDRTGVALLGAIALVAGGTLELDEAWAAIDVSTLALLFGLMVISAQLRLGGFYTFCTRRAGAAKLGPRGFLALVIALAGGLSALLANDVVCLAMTPVLIDVCARRRLDPVPYLLALACASNVGSAATLIGNPQNILIGEVLGLPFGGYLVQAGVPALLGLAATWALLAGLYRGRLERAPERWTAQEDVPFDRWQSAKALVVLVVLVALLVEGSLPRAVTALAAGGVLLLSRRSASRQNLALVDWQLLLLFMGLFVVHRAVEGTGAVERGVAALAERGVALGDPLWLFLVSVPLSNLVSNVPAVMLLLPAAADPAAPVSAGPALALASTLAGNLFLVGSIANLIVVDLAARSGVRIDWRQHARVGVPVALVTLAIAGAWLLAIG